MALHDVRSDDQPLATRSDNASSGSSLVADASTEGVFVNTSVSRSNESKSFVNDSGSSAETTKALSTPIRWTSCGSLDYHKGAPLIALSPILAHRFADEASALGDALSRSQSLPKTGYFASNHIMVNQERAKNMIAPLKRLGELDDIARSHAEAMAAEENIFHSDAAFLRETFSGRSTRLGENVACGPCIRQIHEAMMRNMSDRNNILDRRYKNMGMSTARGEDGMLYLCQVFRG